MCAKRREKRRVRRSFRCADRRRRIRVQQSRGAHIGHLRSNRPVEIVEHSVGDAGSRHTAICAVVRSNRSRNAGSRHILGALSRRESVVVPIKRGVDRSRARVADRQWAKPDARVWQKRRRRRAVSRGRVRNARNIRRALSKPRAFGRRHAAHVGHIGAWRRDAVRRIGLQRLVVGRPNHRDTHLRSPTTSRCGRSPTAAG